MPTGKRDAARKRPRTEDYEEDMDDDNPCGPFLACPFYKLDPRKYHRCVGKYELKRFADVKQHLIRCHVLKGAYHCPRCFSGWDLSGPWEAHIVESACKKVAGFRNLYPEKMYIFDQIPRNLDDSEKWFWMWGKLFPENNQPKSAYVLNGIDEPIALIRQDAEVNLRMDLPIVLPTFNISLPPDSIESLATEIGRIMFENLLIMPPRLPLHPHVGSNGMGVAQLGIIPAQSFVAPHQLSHVSGVSNPVHYYQNRPKAQKIESNSIPNQSQASSTSPEDDSYLVIDAPTIGNFLFHSSEPQVQQGYSVLQPTANQYVAMPSNSAQPFNNDNSFGLVDGDDADYINVESGDGNAAS